jgi:hypothetical protein
VSDARLIVCEILRHEAEAVLAAADLGDITLATFSPLCDGRPNERGLIEAQVAKACADRLPTVVCGGACLAGARLDSVSVYRPPTCFQLLAGAAAVDEEEARRSHLVTPGWLASWRAVLARQGLSEPARAHEVYAEGADRVVLVDTGLVDRGAELEAFARHVGLPAERRQVGLERFAAIVERELWAERYRRSDTDRREGERLIADSYIIIDFSQRLLAEGATGDVPGRLMDLVEMLFAPERIVFVPYEDGRAGVARVSPRGARSADLASELVAMTDDCAPTLSGKGLLMAAGRGRACLGRLAAEGLCFPEYLPRYVDTARILADAMHMTLANARSMGEVRRVEAILRQQRDDLEALVVKRSADLDAAARELQQAVETITALRGLIPLCPACGKLRNGDGRWKPLADWIADGDRVKVPHGLCPDCLGHASAGSNEDG